MYAMLFEAVFALHINLAIAQVSSNEELPSYLWFIVGSFPSTYFVPPWGDQLRFKTIWDLVVL